MCDLNDSINNNSDKDDYHRRLLPHTGKHTLQIADKNQILKSNHLGCKIYVQ